jgi:deoxyribodipyrimidine photolyase-related protein
MPAAPPTVWLFEDQLSPTLLNLREAPAESPVFMVESRTHWSDWPFHKVRLGFQAAAMRHFADELRNSGREVAYYPLKKRGYKDSISAIRDHVKKTKSREFWVTRPSEWHNQAWLDSLREKLGIAIRYFPNRLFLTDRDHFAKWASGRKKLIMENYYRQMRQDHDLLMDGSQPAGGQWNFDKMNRNPAKGKDLHFPPPPRFEPDDITAGALADIEHYFPDHPGSTDGFALPVKREDAHAALMDFIKNRLPLFGDYEDAMLSGQRVMYHSLISPVLNAGLVAPLAAAKAAVKAYERGDAPINAVEGFVRQIIGWREFVYGIYWQFMPEYRSRNQRGDKAKLPDFFWTGDTDMNCLRESLGAVVEDAYSHHIQRLMVICNFATLAGLEPQQVNDWFYSMYVDSWDWVVTPNVVGMAMNSDHDTIATKPYVSSANYIDKMSDYCGDCRYNPKERVGDDACPFNYLYWTFLEEGREKYDKNPRMRMVTKNLDRFGDQTMTQMRDQKQQFVKLTLKSSKKYAAWNVPKGRAEAEG